jgi:hypothetical protein
VRADDIVGAVCEQTGLDDFDGDSYREGLEVLVEAINGEARLSELGEVALETQLTTNLANRLRVTEWLAAHPEAAAAPVDRPVFIIGLPRTGTTLLSYLLDADPATRSLMRWEAMTSVPPPQRATFTSDPRIAEEAASQEMLDAINPEFKAMHYEAPDGPTECVTLFAQDFKSVLWETELNVPSYSAWLDDVDYTSAYRYHRRVLQLLQSGAPGRWVLKSPGHSLALDVLLETYPDAVLVMTHRDPVTVVASTCSLVRSLSGTFSDADHDRYIVEHWPPLLHEMVRRISALRDADREVDERCLDVHYDDLVGDPLATVARIYDHMGADIGADAEAAMKTYLAENPQGKHGTHRYAAPDLGLDPAAVAALFADYRDRYGIAPSPTRSGDG